MKTILLSSLLCLIGGFVSAQNLQILTKADSSDVSNTTITIVGADTDSDVKGYFLVKNTSTSDIEVKVKRYEMNVNGGTENQFCWAFCYTLVTGVTPLYPAVGSPQEGHFVNTLAGSIATNSLDVHHFPLGHTGSEFYRYVVFDGNNPNDSTYLDVYFNIGFNSIEETTLSNVNHYPNPVTDQLTIEFESEIDEKNLQLTVFNVLGEQVETMTPSRGRTLLSTSDYPAGLYFYSISGQGLTTTTKKFIVKR